MIHIYAFILLGYFKETKAYKPIVDLFSLPKGLIDPLYGDIITEDLTWIRLPWVAKTSHLTRRQTDQLSDVL